MRFTFVIGLLGLLLLLAEPVIGADTCVVGSNHLDKYTFAPPRPSLTLRSTPSTGMVEFKVTLPYLQNSIPTIGFWPSVPVLDRMNTQPACSSRNFEPSDFPASLHDAVKTSPSSAYELPSNSFAYPAGTAAGSWIRESSSCHTVTYRASYSIAELAEDCSRNGIPAVFMRSVSTTGTVTYGGTLHLTIDSVSVANDITSPVSSTKYTVDFDIKVRPALKYVSALSSTDFLSTKDFRVADMDLTVDSMGRAHMYVDIEAIDGVSSVCEPIALGAPQEIDFTDLTCSCGERCGALKNSITRVEFTTPDTLKTLAVENGWTLGLTKIGNVCDVQSCDTGSIQGVRFSLFFEDSMTEKVDGPTGTDFMYGRAAIGVGDKLQFLLTDMDGFGRKIKQVHICTVDDLKAAPTSFTKDSVADLLEICPVSTVVDGLDTSIVSLAATPTSGLGVVKDEFGGVHPIPYNKSELVNVKSYDDWATGHVEDEEPDNTNPTDPSDPGDGKDDGYVPVVPDPKPSNGAMRLTTPVYLIGTIAMLALGAILL